MTEYLIILAGFLAISLFLEYKYKLKLYNSKRERVIIPVIFFIIGSLWDYFAVYRNHWSFNFEGPGLIGIKIGLLPLEEYLFMLIIPYFILTAYKVLKKEI